VTTERELEAADAAMKRATMDLWSKDIPGDNDAKSQPLSTIGSD
jgi:hypothetical protein